MGTGFKRHFRCRFQNLELSASEEWSSFIVVEELKSEDKKRLKNLLAKYNLNPICMSAHCNIVKKEVLGHLKNVWILLPKWVLKP